MKLYSIRGKHTPLWIIPFMEYIPLYEIQFHKFDYMTYLLKVLSI